MSRKILKAFTSGSLVVLFIVAVVELASAACTGGVVPGCECGDTVISDTTLNSTHPVIFDPPDTPCPGDGLIVQAGVKLDLNGRVIAGSGTGTGVLIRGNTVTVVKLILSWFGPPHSA